MSLIEDVAKAVAISGNGGTWDDWYNKDQKEFHIKRAKAAIEAVAGYYEGVLDAIGYGNLRATPESYNNAKTIAAEMRRILELNLI